MVVLDAYAVIAFLRDEAPAAEVAALLRGPTAISSVNTAEVVDFLIRRAGLSADDTAISIRLLEQTGMTTLIADDRMGFLAGEIRARRYKRGRVDVSLADCFAVAASLEQQVPLATADPALASIARAEGIEVIGLPDSHGARP